MSKFESNVDFFNQTKKAHPEDAKLMDVTLKYAIEKGANAEAAMGFIAAHTHDHHMSTVETAIHGNTPAGVQENTIGSLNANSIVNEIEADIQNGRLSIEAVQER